MSRNTHLASEKFIWNILSEREQSIDKDEKEQISWIYLSEILLKWKENLAIFVPSTRWGNWNEFNYKERNSKIFSLLNSLIWLDQKMEPVLNLFA